MNNIKDSAYCRLCAKLKQYDELTYLQTGDEMYQKVVNNLSRFNITMDFQQSVLPKTVCLPCVISLEHAFCFVTEVEQAQALLSDFILVEINTAESDSCDENMLCKPPNEPVHVVDSSDEHSRDSIEVNDEGINLSEVFDDEVMSDDSDDVFYDYSVINRNTENEKKHEIQHTDDIIEIKDESDEEVTKDKSGKEENNNAKLKPFNITICSVDKINKQNIRQASIKNMDKIVQKLQRKHKECNAEQCPLKVLAITANSEKDLNNIQKTSNDKQKNYTIVNKNKITDGEHINQSWKDFEWKCKFCKVIFPHIEELQKHSMQYHNFCNSYQCIDCTSVRTKLNCFLSHIRTHRNDLHYSCYKCFKRFPTMYDTRYHKKNVHEKSDYVCFGCNTPFNSIQELNEHAKKFFGKHYSKDERRQLNLHKGTYTKLKRFSCDTCGKIFRHKNNLIPHMLTHTDTLANSCTVCSKKFRLPAHLKLHMRMHTGEKPYSCEVCQRDFRNVCNRNKHVRRSHGIELSRRRQPNKIQQTVPDETSPDGCNKKHDEKKLE